MLGEPHSKSGKQPRKTEGQSTAVPIDRNEAERFLDQLDLDAAGFCLQTFDDLKSRKDPTLAKCFAFATLNEALPELQRFQDRGAGVHVTINETDGTGRQAENVTGIRAVWGDFDQGLPQRLPLEPSIFTETSPGKFHAIWLCDPTDPLSLEEHRTIIDVICDRYGGDKGAKGANRVLRKPGTWNLKDPKNPHQVRIVETSGRRYSRQELLDAFRPVERQRRNGHDRTAYTSHDFGGLARYEEPLQFIPADDRDVWLKVCMALHHESGGSSEGRALADAWSLTSAKYNAKDQDAVWKSFGDATSNPVTGGTIIDLARDHGWRAQSETYSNTRKAEREQNGDDSKEPPSAPDNEPPIELRFDGLARWQENQPADIEFVVDPIIPKGVVTLLVSDGGVGKSMLSQVIGVHVAKGRKLFGLPVHKGKVAGVYCEDPDSILYRRTQNICKAYDVFPDDLVPDLLLESFLDNATELWAERKPTEIGLALDTYLSRNPEITLLIVDNASEVYGDNENIRQEVKSFMRWLTGLAQKHELAVLLIAHTSKSQGPEAFQAASGSTAWVNSSRSLLRLQPPADNPRVLNLQHLKANYSVKLRDPIALSFINGTLVPADHAEKDAGELDAIDAKVFSAVKSVLDASFTISLSDHANNNAWSILRKRAGGLVADLDRKTIDESIERNRQAGMLSAKPNPRTNNPTLILGI